MKIENVDWQITSRCNRNCTYCYGPKNEKDLSFTQMKSIIDLLKAKGVKQIGITGGEPLLYPYIEDLLNYIHNQDIKIYLSTNCDYYKENATLIKNTVSILGVPIDGSSAMIHDTIRGKNSFSSIMFALNDICHSNCATQIKVGTVITKYNYFDLINIEKTISEFKTKILYWKLYELILYSRNIVQAQSLKINIETPSNQLGSHINKNKIVFDTIKIRDKSYFFIKPNGDVFIPILSHNQSMEKKLGNVLNTNFDSIVSNFDKIVNWNGYNKEFRYIKTFDGGNLN